MNSKPILSDTELRTIAQGLKKQPWGIGSRIECAVEFARTAMLTDRAQGLKQYPPGMRPNDPMHMSPEHDHARVVLSSGRYVVRAEETLKGELILHVHRIVNGVEEFPRGYWIGSNSLKFDI